MGLGDVTSFACQRCIESPNVPDAVVLNLRVCDRACAEHTARGRRGPHDRRAVVAKAMARVCIWARGVATCRPSLTQLTEPSCSDCFASIPLHNWSTPHTAAHARHHSHRTSTSTQTGAHADVDSTIVRRETKRGKQNRAPLSPPYACQHPTWQSLAGSSGSSH